MAFRLGLGPVFLYEWITTSRRWQSYAGRSLFVALLLAALYVVWWGETSTPGSLGLNLKTLAKVGERFFYAVIGTQLALVLLAAPAMTASAICIDKARGTLDHLLVTDLSNAEIILGKLATRFASIFGLVLCGVPVLFLCLLEGGIDGTALLGATLVTLGVAVFGGALALTLSVWCRKTYEVLLATYLILTCILLVSPIWHYGVSGLPPLWVEASNPFWLAFAPYSKPGLLTLSDYLLFVAVCAVVALVLVFMAAWRVRAVAVQQGSRPARPGWRLPSILDLSGLSRRLPVFSIDFNPVLWREWRCRRPSHWVRAVWTLYACGALVFSLLAVRQYQKSGILHGELGPFVNAFQVAIGLLLVSVASVTSLAEERARGTLDLLLTTTLPTASIVWGKWLGVYRSVILLAILPVMVAWAIARQNDFWPGVVLMAGLVLAYGAAVTSLGLALATWSRRAGRAIALNVIIYVAVTAGWWLIVFMVLGWGRMGGQGLAAGSPWYGCGLLTADMERSAADRSDYAFDVFWTLFYSGGAGLLLLLTLASFNRCLGRMPFVPVPVQEALRTFPSGAPRAAQASRSPDRRA
jgi:ABC-type transport system involved in multi-copper enzyme maturation permease subunit